MEVGLGWKCCCGYVSLSFNLKVSLMMVFWEMVLILWRMKSMTRATQVLRPLDQDKR